MTIIATLDGVLAADSRILINQDLPDGLHTVVGDKVKRSSCRRLLVGITGPMVEGEEFDRLTDQLLQLIIVAEDSPKRTAKFPQCDLHALILTRDATYLLHQESLVGVDRRYPVAVGSGGDYARTALVDGRSLEEAIEWTIRFDRLCGPPVKTWHSSTLKPFNPHPVPVAEAKRKKRVRA